MSLPSSDHSSLPHLLTTILSFVTTTFFVKTNAERKNNNQTQQNIMPNIFIPHGILSDYPAIKLPNIPKAQRNTTQTAQNMAVNNFP